MVGNVGGKGSSPSVVVDASVHLTDGCNMLKDAMGGRLQMIALTRLWLNLRAHWMTRTFG
jgi:hypothetical protein